MNRRSFLGYFAGALLSTSASLRLAPPLPKILPQYSLVSASYDFNAMAAMAIAFEWDGREYRNACSWYARTDEYYEEAETRLVEWMATVCATS